MPDKNIKVKEEVKVKSGYNPQGEELKVRDKYLLRKKELLDSRKNIGGQNIDEMMRRFDKNYFNRDADIPASELDPNQKPLSVNNAFGKVQAALSILLDRNPKIILNEDLAKYSANRELIKALAEKSWKNTNSLGQFKLSVFNAAKRGWFVGRTYNKKIIHDARFAKSVETPGRIAYETQKITKMDDIAYVNLDNHNTWIDEQARPEDMYSARDAMHREVWHIDDIRRVFPESEFPNMKFVTEGGNTAERIEGDSTSVTDNTGSSGKEMKKGMTELFFYEHQLDDWFIVEINGIMVIWEPLPQNHKRLSYTWGYWNLRSAETIYGIGIVEAMERDETLIDRIVNMTMRQLLICLNPPGFYTGAEDLESENIKITPGVFRRTLDPKNFQWLQVPPADMDRTFGVAIPWLEQKEEQKTGITKRLEGEEQQKGNDLAFEIGVAREATLKRLRLPLQSFQYALQWEFMNRIDLIKQTYSDFQVQHLANQEEIMNYLDEVKNDPDFYFIENEGIPGQEVFYAKQFKEVNLSVEQNDKGGFIETDKKSFFKIKPQYLFWEGDVTIDINSILVQSEELEQANTLRFANLLVPMFQIAIEIALKPAKQLCIAFNKDPKKWLPQAWIDQLEGKKPQQQQISPETQAMMDKNSGQGNQGQEMMKPETVVPEKQLQNPNIIDRISGALKGFKRPNL